MDNKLSDLKRIEQLAQEQIKNLPGYWYEGKNEDIETLQKIVIDAKIKRLQTELYRL